MIAQYEFFGDEVAVFLTHTQRHFIARATLADFFLKCGNRIDFFATNFKNDIAVFKTCFVGRTTFDHFGQEDAFEVGQFVFFFDFLRNIRNLNTEIAALNNTEIDEVAHDFVY